MPVSLRRTLAMLAGGGLLAGLVLSAPVALAGDQETYLVLYAAKAVPTDAARSVTAAGGTLVASYGQIGVAVARSSNSTFKASLSTDSRIAAVAATSRSAVRLPDVSADAAATTTADIPASDTDPLSGLQWDMVQIHTPEAHAITGGSPTVLVGDIDTGLDYTHPDLAANVSDADSANCVSGAPVPGKVAAADDNGHGTHTAGTIAAASNGIGIVGVAPNVKIAGIKAGNADGFFFPEAVVCSFMWAASRGVDVTNNSYFADPWLFNCKNDPEQRAIFSAEQRAIKYAQSKGTVVVAAEGNQSDDLAHPTQDWTSPDDTTPVVRDITNACAVVPVEVPGVVGVTGNGNLEYKTYYSSYGVGTADVVAPGGDRRYQVTAAAVNGRVLSTWPSYIGCAIAPPAGGGLYCYLQGTSMASPHVAGLAALIVSQHPSWSTGAVTGKLFSTADPIACPASMTSPVRYDLFPALDGGAPQVCTGGAGYNSFNGHGQVNALRAVQ
jgi:lantibiotic leader peptide-processing serine protease